MPLGIPVSHEHKDISDSIMGENSGTIMESLNQITVDSTMVNIEFT